MATDMNALNKEQYAELEQTLELRERELLDAVARLREALATPASPEVRDIGEDSQVRMDSSQHLVELARSEHEIAEISAARLRMREGTYGLCEECEEPIPFARLKVRPTARFCMPHEAQRERSAGRS